MLNVATSLKARQEIMKQGTMEHSAMIWKHRTYIVFPKRKQ